MGEQLDLSGQYYRQLFEDASDAMWVQDLSGHIVAANSACAALGGYARDELIGADVRGFLKGGSLARAREVGSKLLRGKLLDQPYELRLSTRDGGERIAEVVSSLVTVDGEVKGFQHVARDVTEQKQLEENVRLFSRLVIRAQERERERMSRELHDDVVQSLVLLSQRVDMITSERRMKLPEPLVDRLEELHALADEVIAKVRRCAQDLRPRILDDLGLTAAIEWMADNLIVEQRIYARVQVSGAEHSLPEEVQLMLFRIAQEALSNVRRHSGATNVLVTAEFLQESVVLTIEDDGEGFVVEEKMQEASGTGTLGLMGMQERTLLVGGTLTVHSEPGKGTTVRAEIPILCRLGGFGLP